jgi:hypothetical protein
MASCTGLPDVIRRSGQPAARIRDLTIYGGAIILGCPNVLIGG